ncbi:hypothetical protein [Escherichia phage KK4]|nr:hypothetical protein [Escherichia phage GADU22]WMM91748.1 hypothetical protein [Escherichia phage KK4]
MNGNSFLNIRLVINMTAITPQEYMASLKEKYNLSATETLFDLPENLQLKFQVEFQKLIHPEQKHFTAVVKSINADGLTIFTRQIVLNLSKGLRPLIWSIIYQEPNNSGYKLRNIYERILYLYRNSRK